MEQKDQVCTESQGLKLEELGISSRPLFCHFWLNMGQESIKEILLVDDKNSRIPELATTWIAPAYTVAELGELLPTLGIKRHKSNNGRGSDYYWLEFRSQDWSDINEAQLLAKFFIYLLENKLINPEPTQQS